jgi:flagellar biosynthetic protein FliR
MNMFAVGIQIKLLVGLAIMFLTVSLLPSIASYIMNMMKHVVKAVAGGLI